MAKEVITQQSPKQTWEGNNERMEACLTGDSSFSFAENILFGLQGCAERISGKKTSQKFMSPVLAIFPLNSNLICIQCLDSLKTIAVTDL